MQESFNEDVERLTKHRQIVKDKFGEDYILVKFKEPTHYKLSDTFFPDGAVDIIGRTEISFYEKEVVPVKKVGKEYVEGVQLMKGFFKIDAYQENIMKFSKLQPFFYDQNGLFWFWDSTSHRYREVDEVDVMNDLDNQLGFCGQTISSGVKHNYIEAFKRVGRLKHPKEAPSRWIQFQDKAFSITSGEIHDVTPDYFFTNPIPYSIGSSPNTPTLDRLFSEWVGSENVDTLYEWIAYCCYREYPIQVIFCLYGSGANGKSQYQKIVNKFLGRENICSTELDLLTTNVFESFKLYRKLACSMGETNFGILKSTSILKKLTSGADLIGFQKKNKNPFDEINYAKIMIATNSLPSSNDTSDGFYRRWMIVRFPNQFSEGKDIMASIPEEEYRNLARKVIDLLPGLLERGKFKGQGTLEERKHDYNMASNPFPIFLKIHCELGTDYYESYGKLYAEYVKWLNANKMRKVKSVEFRSALSDEGLFVVRTSKNVNGEWKSDQWIDGIRLCVNYVNYVADSTSIYSTFSEPQNTVQITQITQTPHEKIYQYIEKYPSNNLFALETLFGELYIKDLLVKGIVMESPKGTVRLV